MPNPPIEVLYGEYFAELPKLLATVERPGDYQASGALACPMPRLEIDGVGLISFPVPAEQAARLVAEAEQAPYGRGEETLVDTTVRKVRQLPPDRFRLGGKTWDVTLRNLVDAAARGLGCRPETVSADLYKLLVYDAGGFFVAHRDTEKAPRMFGTLVVVLPSAHEGGDLVVRHAGRESVVHLGTDEPSELTWAAFYADCQHEVRPVTSGHRVCLIYNLIHSPSPRDLSPLPTAPDTRSAVDAVARLLRDSVADPDAPAKLVYLLDHQYSPAGLSFSGLKGHDAAIGKILAAAAGDSGHVLHLAIVHIAESGGAESGYDGSYGRRSWGRRGYDEDTPASQRDFTIISTEQASRTLDHWINVADQSVDFGTLPLGDDELMPADALDKEKPDEQRVSEATGNEGASFDRAYHRAVFVLWSEARYPEVVLQSGVASALPYLAQLIHGDIPEPGQSGRKASREYMGALAGRMIEAWDRAASPYGHLTREEGAKARSRMLDLLTELGDAALVRRFVQERVTPAYTGAENPALLGCRKVLDSHEFAGLAGSLLAARMETLHEPCFDLVCRALKALSAAKDKKAEPARLGLAKIVIETLPGIRVPHDALRPVEWPASQALKPVETDSLLKLLEALRTVDDGQSLVEATRAIITRPDAFPPDHLLVLVLARFPSGRAGGKDACNTAFDLLWRHSVGFMVTRSEWPPAVPTDWIEPVKVKCTCADCRELQKFAADPVQQVYHFRAAQARRSHVEATILNQGLDMARATQQTGSPHTLVCTKTRRRYQAARGVYEQDIGRIRRLLALADGLPPAATALLDRARATAGRLA